MNLENKDKEIYAAIIAEKHRQQTHLEMIASENYTSPAVLEAMGSHLSDKYAEGYPGKRYYGGCEHVDTVERLAIARAKSIFGAQHINVQPHSGTQANIASYFALLSSGDKIMGMDLSCGGHLSHGHPLNFSGKTYKVISYGVDKKTGLIDYDKLRALAMKEKPKMIICGASAYPRKINFEKFKEIADETGAYLLADIAHIAGLVAAGLHPDPVGVCDIVTTTTHKTLRGPRGGMIMSKECYAADIDRAVFPGTQGGPLMHVIAAKAVCFKEALEESFKEYAKKIIDNAQALAQELTANGINLVSGGTDNHLLLLDLRNQDITGKDAESLLQSAGIVANKNTIPYDPQKPFIASGLRLGTPMLTTRGLGIEEMRQIAGLIIKVLKVKDQNTVDLAKKEVELLCEKFPII